MSKRKSQADESVPMPTVKKMKLDKSIQYTEIGSLASEIKRLKFLGIVTTITALRECNNSQIFVFDVQDKTGVIRCSAYDETAVKLAKIVKQNKMFHITGIKLKRANRMFNSVDNDYEIEIMDDAEVVEIVGSPELVPTFERKDIFTDFCDISEQPTDKAINVVGILKHTGNLELINLVKSNDQVYKRVLQLMDQYKNNIHVTLWGKVAQNWAYKKYDVLTFKSVGVNEFNGLFGIKVYASSIITKNDDNEKSEKLMEIVAEILENNKK